MDNTIVISTPPHVKSKRTTRGIMIDVCIALSPAAIAGCVFFGWQALLIILISVFTCAATEFIYFFIANGGFSNKCRDAGAVCKRFVRQFDFTSVVTGLILALILPTTDKWWQVFYEVIFGAIFSIAVVKMFFGGTGKNLVNPAAAGRAFMFLSFGLTTYVAANFGPVMDGSEVLTGATNLSGSILMGNGNVLNLVDLLLGTGKAGCIGETCIIAILIGYVYLCARGVIKWWQPLLFFVILGFTAVIMNGFYGETYVFDMNAFLPAILSGGAAFAGVFMLTDYVTSPKGVWGQTFYYGFAAILLGVLRYFTKIEVASFIILIMNIITPLIDRYMIEKPFGYKKEKKQKESN